MNDSFLTTQLTSLMERYEVANNSHVVTQVLPFIADDASYWFSDGSHEGREQISQALAATFDTIQDENYRISELVWVLVRPDAAVCRYRFAWSGLIDGKPRSGAGRGTNVWELRGSNWLIVHEQLTSD